MAHTISSAAHLDFVLLPFPADVLLQGCNSLSIARRILYADHRTRKENDNTTILTDCLFPLLGRKRTIYTEKIKNKAKPNTKPHTQKNPKTPQLDGTGQV